MFYYIGTASDAYERNETIMEERSMEYRQMKQRGDRTMRELGTARRLLMEEIREKKSVANSGKCKRVHSGRVRVRTASDVLSDRDWDRMRHIPFPHTCFSMPFFSDMPANSQYLL